MGLTKRTAFALAATTTLLGACSTGYGGGYGMASAGYYGDSYYDDGYYGWDDNFYYPGTGYYVYDRQRRAHRVAVDHVRGGAIRVPTGRGRVLDRAPRQRVLARRHAARPRNPSDLAAAGHAHEHRIGQLGRLTNSGSHQLIALLLLVQRFPCLAEVRL